MADKKNKENEQSQLRVPKAKTSRFGLKVPPIRMPHEDLIKPEFPKLEVVPEIVPAEDIDKNETLPSHTSQSTHTSQTRHTRQPDIAPVKNFQKVPNSITKSAIPDGLFKPGKSKHLYDIVYSLTRGAIEPKRIVRMSKTKLRKLAGIGSRITFDSCVNHLEVVGLLKVTIHIGEHEGNEFEVFLPEEITMTSQTRQTAMTSLTRYAQNLDTLVSLESSQSSQGSEPINTGIPATPKTLINTYKNDDEAFVDFIDKFQTAAVKLTGKKLSKYDREKFGDLAELIILELEVAAARAGGVSSVPAFLTEVLRRQIFASKSKVQSSKSKVQPDTVGKNDSEPWVPEPLDEEGRAEALKMLREMSAMMLERYGDGSIENHRAVYTEEDWIWLNEKLQEKL